MRLCPAYPSNPRSYIEGESPHLWRDIQSKLEGTIYTAAKSIQEVGGKALPIVCDIRFEEQVQAAVTKTVEEFGGIDICVNNAQRHLAEP
jgi:NAD(P)-dependent dehydrogenase (short-subunit alcohol dehydrogenase family)